MVRSALSGKAFVDERTAKVNVAHAAEDYKRLFALNQGLVTLQALANAANDPKTSQFQLAAIQTAFARGVDEVTGYVEKTRFSEFRLTAGIATNSAATTAGVVTASDSYTTPPLVRGTSDTVVPAFEGAVQFDLTVNRPASGSIPAKTTTINIDLAELGSTPRSISAVASYINDKLIAAGVGVRVSLDRTTTPPETVTVNGQTQTISEEQPQFGLKFSGLTFESISFSAATASPAVYVAQNAGNPDPDGDAATNDGVQQQELLKFETGAGVDAYRRPGDQNFVAGRVFSEALPEGVTKVHATAAGADGSIYLLADATGTVAGQPIKGDQDAVLLKYDSAGHLVYARTLGAGSTASGFSLAVSDAGKVAIAGSITGVLDNGEAGANSKVSDSFVTVFDSQGQELWSDRHGADGADEAQAVAFDASGNIYVAGRAQGSIGGGTAIGGWDGYLRAYDASGHVQSTRQFGSPGDDSIGGIAVNGTDVLVASQDGGAAVVRRFDVTDPKQISLAASRNLGGLAGGSVSGIGLDGGGNVLIGGSSGTDLNVGTTTLARTGGLDAFAVRLSVDLVASASDAVAYFGGGGADQVTAATVANGQVWLTGTSKTALPGLDPVGKLDGFVAALDVGAGAVTYSQRFTAKDEFDTPESIAVDTSGGSVLDRLGLPRGEIKFGGSDLLTSATSIRAGDQFQIRLGSSRTPATITIDADETLSSLSDKIRNAGLFGINVSTVSDGEKSTLRLKAANDRQSFELLPGPEGRDALAALGLRIGLVRNTVVDKVKGVIPADRGKQTYGLRLPLRLDLDSKVHIGAALEAIANAITAVRGIYSDLRRAADPLQAKPTVSGQAPAYLTARIADYRAALDRLTAGSPLAGLIG